MPLGLSIGGSLDVLLRGRTYTKRPCGCDKTLWGGISTVCVRRSWSARTALTNMAIQATLPISEASCTTMACVAVPSRSVHGGNPSFDHQHVRALEAPLALSRFRGRGGLVLEKIRPVAASPSQAAFWPLTLASDQGAKKRLARSTLVR